jgi:hypothetical protein
LLERFKEFHLLFGIRKHCTVTAEEPMC